MDPNFMKNFESFLQTPQNTDRIFNTRFLNQHPLEPTLKGFVFLDVFPVLVQCRGTDQMQFTTGQHRLQQVTSIHGAFCLTSTDNIVNFINKKNDLAFTLFDFF